MIDIYVINLEERPDRIKTLKNNFQKFKNINLIIVGAIKHENGHIGCFLSHKKCLQIAKNSNMDKIIVIEDDCLPMPRFEERLMTILEYLSLNDDWDIFNGCLMGARLENVIKKCTYKDIDLYQINGGSSSHFMVYNNNSYDFYLEQDETKSCVDRCWYNKLRAYTVVPFLAKQIPTYSDIEKKENNCLLKMQRTETRLLEYGKENK